MTTLEVFDPSGATEILQLHAPRHNSLDGKTIGYVSNDEWQAHRILPLIAELMENEFNGLKTIHYTEFPIGNLNIDSDQTIEQAKKRGVDAVVIGNAA
jgi:hypothetical protein